MSMKIQDATGMHFTPAKPGSYFGRFVQVVNIGIQTRDPYQGQDKKPVNQIVFTVEVPKLRVEIEGVSKPRWFSKQIVFFNSEASVLTKMIGPLTDNGDLVSLLNKPVTVQIGVTSTGKNKVIAFTACPEEVTVPPLESPITVFDFYNPDVEEFGHLNPWIKKLIVNALDFNESRLQRLLDIHEIPYEEYQL
jgi:hypothetical protein